MFSRTSPHPLKGLAAGLAGGLAATWLMTRFQEQVPPKAFARLLGEDGPDGSSGDDEEPSTVKAAEAISEGVLNHELTEAEKAPAGNAVHYGLGTSAGTVYGLLAEYAPEVTHGMGTGFGTLFWLAADETAVPALGLADPPWETQPSVHLYGLAAHLVYGLTTEGVRRLVRAALG